MKTDQVNLLFPGAECLERPTADSPLQYSHSSHFTYFLLDAFSSYSFRNLVFHMKEMFLLALRTLD